MRNSRRRFMQWGAGAVALPLLARMVQAIDYPARPVRVVVGVAGGAQDIVARLLNEWLSAHLGQPFVLETRPGAGTNIATEFVVRAPADGYTLLFVGAPSAINATLYEKLSFNFLRDIAPVASIMRTPEVLVANPSVPARSIPELVAYAKRNPGKLNIASPGTGTGPHMSAELFKMLAGVEMTHVPYRGGGPAMVDLMGGQVQLLFIAPVVALQQIRAGKLRALAISSRSRSQVLPDVPALAEFLPGFESGGFFGIGAPRNTPVHVVGRLNKEVNAALTDPGMKARIAEMGATILSGSPADFGKVLASETDKWAKVIRFAGIKPA